MGDITLNDITVTVLKLSGVSLSDVQTMTIDNEDVGAPDTLTTGTFTDASGLAVMMTGFGRDSDQAGLTAHVIAGTGWTEVTGRAGASWSRTAWMHVATAVDKSDDHRRGVQRDGRRAQSSIEDFCGYRRAV